MLMAEGRRNFIRNFDRAAERGRRMGQLAVIPVVVLIAVVAMMSNCIQK